VTSQAVKSVALCAVALSLLQAARADTTIIDGPVTEIPGLTNPPSPINLNGNDTLIIGPAGSVTVTGITTSGIEAGGGSNTITNSGSISTAGDGGNGIQVFDGSSAITNRGSISTVGIGGFGIEATGGSNTITNSGSISTSGLSGVGILVYDGSSAITNSGSISTAGDRGAGLEGGGGFNTFTNSGTITTAGKAAYGAYALSNSNRITSSGTITTSGASAIGIYTTGTSNTITNSGTITTSGANAAGIYAEVGSNTITNSGVISTSGANASGIVALGNSNTITNSGSILSKNSYAIYLNGSGNTFNSLNNFIGGVIFMGTSGTVNFTTGANYSKLYTFEGTLAAINSSGTVPLFTNLSTNQAGTYDPTIFASSSDALADMTSTISSLTPGRINGSDQDHPLWVRGFGMAASYEGTDATLDRSYNYSGVAIGYDFKRSEDLRLGVLGGYGQTSLWANAESTQSFNTSSDDGFLGLYGQKRWKNVAVDFALYGGVQSFQQQRYVNDNLAYLGNSSANASYQGWWIAPEAGITYNAGEVNGWSFLPTARLRYAQQWMGGYTETGGGSANATVNGRNVAIGQSFVGIGTRKTMKTLMGKDTKMVLDGQVGYIYRGVVGDDSVNVTMIGQSQSLATESSSRNAVAVSAGVTLDLSSAVALKIRGDFAAGGGMQYGSGGWAGLSVKF